MLIKEIMTPHPVVADPDMSVTRAQRLMKEGNIRHLPVIREGKGLVGLVTRDSLNRALPSALTSLSIWEINYQLGRIQIRDVMVKPVITVTEDVTVEEAARVMINRKIGGLPVMRGSTLVGMITESDLFKTFLELLGARTWGLRVAIKVGEGHGVLARLTQQISDHGADFVSLGTFWGDDLTNREIAFKVQGVEQATVELICRDLGAEIIDIREMA